MCNCKTKSAFKEEKHDKTLAEDANSVKYRNFNFSNSENRVIETKKPIKLGSKDRVKLRFQKNNTDIIEKPIINQP